VTKRILKIPQKIQKTEPIKIKNKYVFSVDLEKESGRETPAPCPPICQEAKVVY
jgi:hypothetical protein